ncbi:NACHT domain-containing protein [Pseudoduganella lutea]|uniref:NACHT domain-containing protein n=1 Tax=Pseudoduganella lutea TaxID=321985 RepID=A0A4P6L2X5_9BURK|nr:NACHT domain-containing protein [Pseudoduganella lutea]QBE65771.1 NACHT domain-containing protein [Pseudoduganella lutea]
MRRLSLVEWLGDGERLALLGDAGCGKSTLLRVIALDLLYRHAHFPEVGSRWGQHFPVYIPFARWSSHVARDGNPICIKEIVRRSLEQLLTSSIVDLLDRAIDDQRVLLLIDGLDEWSSEQAARVTLSALVVTVEAHDVPVIVPGRPRGLSRIGALPAGWKRGTIAPLAAVQQASITGGWFGRYASSAVDDADVSETKLRTSRFMAELARDANLGTLATVPLLLIGLVTLALRGQILPRVDSSVSQLAGNGIYFLSLKGTSMVRYVELSTDHQFFMRCANERYREIVVDQVATSGALLQVHGKVCLAFELKRF